MMVPLLIHHVALHDPSSPLTPSAKYDSSMKSSTVLKNADVQVFPSELFVAIFNKIKPSDSVKLLFGP